MADNLSQVTIYTDGACRPNPGAGGWAALLNAGAHQKVLSGHEPNSTNNRMELRAAVEALKALHRPCLVDLYTDSEYLKKGITEWLPGWQKRGWKRKGGQLANTDLWQELVSAMKPHTIRWRWVRGHSVDPLNLRVDELARKAIDSVTL